MPAEIERAFSHRIRGAPLAYERGGSARPERETAKQHQAGIVQQVGPDELMTRCVIELVDVEIERVTRVHPDDVVGAARIEQIDRMPIAQHMDELRGVVERIVRLGPSRTEPGEAHVTGRYLIRN